MATTMTDAEFVKFYLDKRPELRTWGQQQGLASDQQIIDRWLALKPPELRGDNTVAGMRKHAQELKWIEGGAEPPKEEKPTTTHGRLVAWAKKFRDTNKRSPTVDEFVVQARLLVPELTDEGARQLYEKGRVWWHSYNEEPPDDVWDAWLKAAIKPEPLIDRDRLKQEQQQFWAQLLGGLSGPANWLRYWQTLSRTPQATNLVDLIRNRIPGAIPPADPANSWANISDDIWEQLFPGVPRPRPGGQTAADARRSVSPTPDVSPVPLPQTSQTVPAVVAGQVTPQAAAAMSAANQPLASKQQVREAQPYVAQTAATTAPAAIAATATTTPAWMTRGYYGPDDTRMDKSWDPYQHIDARTYWNAMRNPTLKAGLEGVWSAGTYGDPADIWNEVQRVLPKGRASASTRWI